MSYSTKIYTSATFVEGDFNASVDYFKELINTTIESGYRTEIGIFSSTLEYYQINKSYSLFNANCLQMSMKGFNQDRLKDYTSISSFMDNQLEISSATIRPNSAKPVFEKLFLNSSFTRSGAAEEIKNEVKNNSFSYSYKKRSLAYYNTLEVSK